MSARTSRLAWISRRRGNRVGPIDASDLSAFRVIGAIILAVALVVTAIYAVDFDYAAYTTFRGELLTARGTVLAVEPTNSHEPQSRITTSASRYRWRDETTQIDAVRYTFLGPDRVERDGISYRPNSRLKVGTTVTVEYPAGRPEVSRIRGYRTQKFDTLPIGLPILAGVGIGLLALGAFYRTGARRHPGS